MGRFRFNKERIFGQPSRRRRHYDDDDDALAS